MHLPSKNDCSGKIMKINQYVSKDAAFILRKSDVDRCRY